ncbi:MAG: hypothetical protein ABIM20_08050 [candidate division WOR-3 bacterium]
MQIYFINQRFTREKCKFPIISDFPILSLRAELDYIERAELLKRRKEIYEAMFPNATKAEKVKKNLKQFKNIPEKDIVSFSEDTAQKTGESQRHIRRLIQIAESLPEDVKDTVKKIDLPMRELSFTVSHHKPI